MGGTAAKSRTQRPRLRDRSAPNPTPKWGATACGLLATRASRQLKYGEVWVCFEAEYDSNALS